MDRTPDAPYELADDPGHPIPRVYAYDTALTFEGGGAYVGIAIATSLDATSRSLMRFRAKEKFYLDNLYSEWGRNEWGTPKKGKIKIYVYIHPASSQEAFDMLSVSLRRSARPRRRVDNNQSDSAFSLRSSWKPKLFALSGRFVNLMPRSGKPK